MIGAGLKLIDEAFDEGTFEKGRASAIAFLLLLIWIGISALDEGSATILLSILTGVLLTGKIDNKVFGLCTATILGVLLFLQRLLWPPLLFLTGAGVIDEKGNDYVDAHRANRFVSFFFLHRFTMKIGVALVCAAGVFPWHYLLAFLLFDIGYDTVGILSRHYSRAQDGVGETRSPGRDIPAVTLALQCHE
ncbi:MAG: hypothetical protein D6733_02015 [Methanobacteriota archaeon]|nr:MAG: hypothetical protein D6733_02015 [Euryarchaeota archaeon]